LEIHELLNLYSTEKYSFEIRLHEVVLIESHSSILIKLPVVEKPCQGLGLKRNQIVSKGETRRRRIPRENRAISYEV